MERENKKRGREEGEGKKDLFVKTSKKQSRGHMVVEAQDESNISSDNYLALGVFDFPWLHDDDGIISKSDSDEWKFQDTFSTSLDDIEFTRQWQRQYLYETTTTTTMSMNFPDNKFEGPFKGEEIDELEIGNVDCSIWSSMINQPLQQGVSND